MGRFINADDLLGQPGALLSHNVFAYCGNNPVNRADESGRGWHILIGAAIGGTIGGIVAAVAEAATGADFADVAAAALGGVIGGSIQGAAAAAWGMTGSLIGGPAGGAIGNLTEQACSDWWHGRPVDINWVEFGVCTVSGLATSVGQTGISNAAKIAGQYLAPALIQANMEITTETTIRGIQNAVEQNNSNNSGSNWYDYRSNFEGWREYGLY